MKPILPQTPVYARAAVIALLGLAVGACATPPDPGLMPDIDTAAPMVIGHRGASGYRPEHTLAAYALAIAQGADAIEPDLVITADGVLIARHENAIGATTDIARRPEFAARRTTKTVDGTQITDWFTEDFTLAELKTLRAVERLPQVRPANVQFNGQFEVPTFAEIIELVQVENARRAATTRAPVIGIVAEIKHSTYFRTLGKPLEEPVAEALRRAGLDSTRAPTLIQSFEVASLQKLRTLTRVRLLQLIDNKGAPFDHVASGDPRTYADLLTPTGLDGIATYAAGIAVEKQLVIPVTGDGQLGTATVLVEEAHRRGLTVFVWTFRRENRFLPPALRSAEGANAAGALDREIDAYLLTGIDGLFADNPDIAVRARDRLPRS